MSDDKKKELPSCVAFGMRYWKRLRAKLDKVGSDWMPSKLQNDWILACQVFYLLHLLIDDDDEYDNKLFFLLGYKLIDLVSVVNHALVNFDNDKKEN